MLYEETGLTIHNEGYPIDVDVQDNNANISLSSVYVKKSCLRTCDICFNFRLLEYSSYSIRQVCGQSHNREYEPCPTVYPVMGDVPLKDSFALPQVVHPFSMVKKHIKINKLDKNDDSIRYLTTTTSSNSMISSHADDFDVSSCGLLQSFKHVLFYRECLKSDRYIVSGVLCSSDQVFYTDLGGLVVMVYAKDLYPDMAIKSAYHNHRVLKIESYSSQTPTHRFCTISSIGKISGIALSCGVIAGTYHKDAGKGLLTSNCK